MSTKNPHALLARRLSYLVFLVMAVFILATFRQYGISNDEEVQHIYGRLLLDFYRSSFNDQSAFHYKNLYLYGGFFDLIAALLEKCLPFWIWDMRHLLSALFGFAGLVGAYKIARQLGGESAGLIALVLMVITACWTGAMFTHTKDIPFATCMLWALYYTMQFVTMQLVPRVPHVSRAASIKLGIAIGCALGLRIGGVFAVFYLGLLIMLAAVYQPGGWAYKRRFLLQSIAALIPAGVAALVLTSVFWPWAVMSPSHPLQAARAFSHFAFDMLTMLDGKVMRIGDVPNTYLHQYLIVRLPELVLLGLAGLLVSGSVLLARKQAAPAPAEILRWACVVLAALFPLVFTLLDKPALYNGVRHFTFVVPPLLILAALGLQLSWNLLRTRPVLKGLFGLIALALLADVAVTLLRLHPYQYVYYNHFAGTTAHAEKNWESDYWASSMREAAHELEQKVQGPGPYRVAVCAESLQGSAYLDPRFIVSKQWISADFFLSTTNMHCDQVLQGSVMYKVERLGATLAVVKDRRALSGNDRLPTPAPTE